MPKLAKSGKIGHRIAVGRNRYKEQTRYRSANTIQNEPTVITARARAALGKISENCGKSGSAPSAGFLRPVGARCAEFQAGGAFRILDFAKIGARETGPTGNPTCFRKAPPGCRISGRTVLAKTRARVFAKSRNFGVSAFLSFWKLRSFGVPEFIGRRSNPESAECKENHTTHLCPGPKARWVVNPSE